MCFYLLFRGSITKMESTKNTHQRITKNKRNKDGDVEYFLDRGSTWEQQENFLLLSEQIVVKKEICKSEDSFMVQSDVGDKQLVHVGNVKEEIVESKTDIFCNIVRNLLTDDAEMSSEKQGEDKQLNQNNEAIDDANINFHCKMCNKTFSKRSSLARHLKTHNSVKRFKCSECDKQFKYNSSLKVHMFTHTGEKKYACKMP